MDSFCGNDSASGSVCSNREPFLFQHTCLQFMCLFEFCLMPPFYPSPPSFSPFFLSFRVVHERLKLHPCSKKDVWTYWKGYFLARVTATHLLPPLCLPLDFLFFPTFKAISLCWRSACTGHQRPVGSSFKSMGIVMTEGHPSSFTSFG